MLGVLPGRLRDAEPILIAAHYDTCGTQPGADDNAAAVAIAASLVEPLRELSLKRDVVFAYYDAEEPPYFLSEAMGSNYFYVKQRRQPLHCAFVMDLVGHNVQFPGFENALFVTGIESDPAWQDPLRQWVAATERLSIVATRTDYIGNLSDYAAIRADRRPFLFLSCGQWEHYHQPTDTPEKLNYEKMAAIRDLLLEMTSASDALELQGPFDEHETLPLEIETFERAAGALLQQFGIELKTREDMDRVVQMVMSMLLSS